jgi:hypothetical protein
MSRPEFKISVRVTRTVKCREGFYVLFNGNRLQFKRRADAVGAVQSLLDMQRFQIVTVREYARRKSVAKQMPK